MRRWPSHVATRDYPAELACGARADGMPPDTSIRVGAGREQGKALFGPDETLVIKAGTAQGVKVGQEYYVRRVVADRFVRPPGDNVAPIEHPHRRLGSHRRCANDSAIADSDQGMRCHRRGGLSGAVTSSRPFRRGGGRPVNRISRTRATSCSATNAVRWRRRAT